MWLGHLPRPSELQVVVSYIWRLDKKTVLRHGVVVWQAVCIVMKVLALSSLMTAEPMSSYIRTSLVVRVTAYWNLMCGYICWSFRRAQATTYAQTVVVIKDSVVSSFPENSCSRSRFRTRSRPMNRQSALSRDFSDCGGFAAAFQSALISRAMKGVNSGHLTQILLALSMIWRLSLVSEFSWKSNSNLVRVLHFPLCIRVRYKLLV